MGEEATFEGFPARLFRDRRERVLEQLGRGAMVLPAAPPLVRSRDAEIRYRPDSELFYLTGFAEPGAVLVLRGFADDDRSLLFVRPRSAEEELWTGPRADPEAVAEGVGVDAARSVEELSAALPGLLEGAARIHFRLGAHPEVEPLVVRALETARRKGQRKGTGPRGVLDPGEILDELRLRKSPEEVEALREAVRVTARGFREAAGVIGPGAGEWEVEAVLEAAFRREGARSPAFGTIVASGPNACVLHYLENGRRMEEGELVLVDAGAEVRMYAGDVSRTFPVSGRFSPEQGELCGLVDEARRRAVEAVRPGASVRDVHEAAVEVLTDGLVELGVLRGERDALLEAKAYKPFFPHRTSHWLGVDTHDPGDYARDDEPRILEEGMVLTVEPGLYFRPDWEAAWEKVLEGEGGAGPAGGGGGEPHGAEARGEVFARVRPELLGTGIRIEDDVLVTRDGAEVLSADLPAGPREVEGLVGS